MTIEISPDLEKKIVNFCDEELNYHINETDCPSWYAEETEAQIELLRLMGYVDMANEYAYQYRKACVEFPEEEEENEYDDIDEENGYSDDESSEIDEDDEI